MISKILTEIDIFLKKFALLNFYQWTIAFFTHKQIGERPQEKPRSPDTSPDEDTEEKIYLYEGKSIRQLISLSRNTNSQP